MDRQRRRLVAAVSIGPAIGFGVTRRARACLVGKWKVRCPKGHDDIVDQVTCNHTCEKCGAKAMIDGAGCVVCPNDHATYVVTGDRNERSKWLASFHCPICKEECLIK